jgi:hypothetical protein
MSALMQDTIRSQGNECIDKIFFKIMPSSVADNGSWSHGSLFKPNGKSNQIKPTKEAEFMKGCTKKKRTRTDVCTRSKRKETEFNFKIILF